MRNAERQRGTVLLMALVVMSGVVISSVGLGSLILSSLQQTRAIDSASVAYYAAESGVEEALFTARHRNSAGALAEGEAVLPASVSAAQTLTNNASWKRTVTGRESVIYAGTIPQDSILEVALYDPDAQTTAQDIGRVQIDWTDSCGGCTVVQTTLIGWQSGGPVIWDPNASTALFTWNLSGASVTLADPNRLYRLRLGAKKGAMENVQIRAYSGAGAATTLPGRIRVDAEGSFGNVKQKLTATLPRRIPLAGIFDFVVFSECSLVKGGAISCP